MTFTQFGTPSPLRGGSGRGSWYKVQSPWQGWLVSDWDPPPNLPRKGGGALKRGGKATLSCEACLPLPWVFTNSCLGSNGALMLVVML